MKPPPSSALVNRIILLTLTLLMFAGSLGLGAVWMRQGISQAANESRALVVKIENLERRLDAVNADIAKAELPQALKEQNQVMRLGLATPREANVVRVNEIPELRLARRRNAEVFSVQPASLAFSGARPAESVESLPTVAVRRPAFQLVTASLQ